MAKWSGLDKHITLEDAEQEQDRLFDRPPRQPSPATRRALAQAERQAPPVDTTRIKAGQRTRRVS